MSNTPKTSDDSSLNICPVCKEKVTEFSPEHGGTASTAVEQYEGEVLVQRWHHDCYFKDLNGKEKKPTS